MAFCIKAEALAVWHFFMFGVRDSTPYFRCLAFTQHWYDRLAGTREVMVGSDAFAFCAQLIERGVCGRMRGRNFHLLPPKQNVGTIL